MLNRLKQSRLIWFGVGGILIAIIIVLRMPGSPAQAQISTPLASSPFKDNITAAGIIEANTGNINVGSPLPGIAQQLYVKVGQQIKVGDPLFQLDSRESYINWLSAKAELQTAQAQLTEAQAELASNKAYLAMGTQLSVKNAISKQELIQKQTAAQVAAAKVDLAQANVLLVKAKLDAAALTLDQHTIRSPINGEVLRINIHLGEYVPLNNLNNQPLMVIGDIQHSYLRVDVDEDDAWRFHKDAKAVAYLPSNINVMRTLKFVRIEPFLVGKTSLTGDSAEKINTRVLQVIYSIEPGGNTPLYVGQQLEVFIDVPHSKKAS